MLRLPRSLLDLCDRVLAAVRRWPAPLARFLVHYRIRLSVALFASLIGISLLTGARPQNVTDPLNPFAVAGVGLLLLGLAIRSWAAGVLHKLDELSTRGPYRLVRHPLYVGSLAMMIGACLLIDDYKNLCVVLGFALLVYVPQIRSEERALSQRFSDSWTAYAGRTGRILPRRLWCDLRSDWQFSQWLKNREYQAIIAVALGLVAVKAWDLLGQ